MICFRFHNSAVAYTVALGLFLAVGRETTGKIPPGKVCTLSGPVHVTPKKFINGAFIRITHQMFSVHTTPEKFENTTITGHFEFMFLGKLGERSHVIIVTSSFLKSCVFKMSSVHTKTQSQCFKFLRREGRFRKALFW